LERFAITGVHREIDKLMDQLSNGLGQALPVWVVRARFPLDHLVAQGGASCVDRILRHQLQSLLAGSETVIRIYSTICILAI
jgi:hypothetical protein